MDDTRVETQTEERRQECLLMSSGKIQKLIRKTRRSRRRNAEFYVIHVTPAAEKPGEFHIGEEIAAKQCENGFRSLISRDSPLIPTLPPKPHPPNTRRRCLPPPHQTKHAFGNILNHPLHHHTQPLGHVGGPPLGPPELTRHTNRTLLRPLNKSLHYYTFHSLYPEDVVFNSSSLSHTHALGTALTSQSRKKRPRMHAPRHGARHY
jgi:hypothetical protein